MPGLSIASTELAWFVVAGVLALVTLVCVVLAITSIWATRLKKARDGVIGAAIAAFIAAAAIAGLTVTGAHNRYNTLGAVRSLQHRGFTVITLSLTSATDIGTNARVVGSGGCIAPVTVTIVPNQSGDERYSVQFLGRVIFGPDDIRCPR